MVINHLNFKLFFYAIIIIVIMLFIQLKKVKFHVHSNNKVSIAVESREVLLDPFYFHITVLNI